MVVQIKKIKIIICSFFLLFFLFGCSNGKEISNTGCEDYIINTLSEPTLLSKIISEDHKPLVSIEDLSPSSIKTPDRVADVQIELNENKLIIWFILVDSENNSVISELNGQIVIYSNPSLDKNEVISIYSNNYQFNEDDFKKVKYQDGDKIEQNIALVIDDINLDDLMRKRKSCLSSISIKLSNENVSLEANPLFYLK